MTDRPLDDQSLVPPEGRALLTTQLLPGERVIATLEGQNHSAIAATDRRIAIWKHELLRTWSRSEITRIEFESGHLSSHVALRGPSLPDRKWGFTDIVTATSVIGVKDKKRAEAVTSFLRVSPVHPSAYDPTAPFAGGHYTGAGVEGAYFVACAGGGGYVAMFDDHLKLKAKGMAGALRLGLFRGDKEIPYDQLTAIRWKEPGVVDGNIQFTLMGGSNLKVAAADENAMAFTGSSVEEFRQLKLEVEKRMADVRLARLGATSGIDRATAGSSPEDQLRRLKALNDEGILTDEEFAAKKAELLSRM